MSKKKKQHDPEIAELIERLKKTEYNEKQECFHFGKCGGCLYSGFTYDAQLKIKQEQIKKLFKSYIDDSIWDETIKSPKQYEYRNKMELSFGDETKGGDLSLGMHKRGAHYDIITVSQCKIMDSDFKKILTTTLEFFKNENIPFYHTNSRQGFLRNLLLRKAENTNQILIDLVTTSSCTYNIYITRWKDAILNLSLEGKIVSILRTKNDVLSEVVKDEGTDVLYGEDYFYEKLLGLDFKVTPFSFFQTNTHGAEKLYEKVREYIGEIKGKVIYDLYSGTGTITQIMAKSSNKVYGVEIVEEAVEAARENARLNGIENTEFICGDVLKVIDEFSKRNSLYQKPDVIVLDPPRDGIHPKALPKIIDFNVNEIIYIACKPTSLYRDMEKFSEGGYNITRACLVDMFPWTANVEMVVLMSKDKDS